MKHISLHAENFMTIEDVNLDLSNPGVYLVLGSNNFLDKCADNNMSGKSSLFVESLVWCLFGVTIRGLSADSIVREGSKGGTSVELELDIDGKPLLVSRFRKHKKNKNKLLIKFGGEDLTGPSNTATQSTLESIIGYDFSSYCRTTIFTDDSSLAFATANDKEQKSFLERILDLSLYSEAQRVAKSKVTDLKSDLAKLTIQFRGLEEGREKSLTRMEKLVEDFENFESKKSTRLNAVQRDIKEISAKLKTPPVDLSPQINELKTMDSKIREQKEKFSKKSWEIDSLNQKIRSLKVNIQDKESDIEALKTAKCFECKQDLPQDAKLASKQKSEAKLSSLKADLKSCQKTLRQVQAEIKKLESPGEEKAVREQLNALLTEQATKDQEIEFHKRTLKNLRRELEDLEQSNPYQKLFEDAEMEITNLQTRMDQIQVEVGKLETELEQNQFWVNGFSNQGIKSMLLDSVTPYLDDRVQKYAEVLTNGKIQINFSTLTKLQSGETREKFSVDIDSSSGAKSHQGASAGEKRRIDIAILLALSDLADARYGNPGLMVCDEIFDCLDQTGISLLMGLLHEIGKEKAVYVVSHSSDLKSLFPNTIMVNRNRQGITQIA